MKATKYLVLNIYIQDSFKKFSLLFGQAEMVFVIVWFLDHFKLEPAPSVNGLWIIAFVSHLHVCVTKFKPSLMFSQLLVLTSNNVIWVPFFTILFDEAQHVVKTSTTGYVPVCYEVINLFIEPQNFLLMFFISKLKGLYLIVTSCDGLLMFFLYFVSKLWESVGTSHCSSVFWSPLLLAVDLKLTARTSLPHWYSNRQADCF